MALPVGSDHQPAQRRRRPVELHANRLDQPPRLAEASGEARRPGEVCAHVVEGFRQRRHLDVVVSLLFDHVSRASQRRHFASVRNRQALEFPVHGSFFSNQCSA
ncbi:hypothetical protein ACWDKQ_19810 [Saccharopolyspora sp. NPDC000995]